MKSGLCSITFKEFSVPQVVKMAVDAKFEAIEWAGNMHVPPGDSAAAEEARRCTVDSGLTVSSYGSYYRVIDKEGMPEDFSPVLETALTLGADTVRIWPGFFSSEIASPEYRLKFIEKLRADLNVAAAQGVRVALEFHVGTLTDSNTAALKLFEEIAHPNLFTYWQPMYWIADPEYRAEGLRRLKERVLNLHVFHWLYQPYNGNWGKNVDRRPLEEGAGDWQKYLSVGLPPGNHYALIEFVRDDSPEQFMKDAAVLRKWLTHG